MTRTVKVTVKTSNTGQLIATDAIAVEGLPVATNRMDNLTDVDADTEIEGGVPRYDAQTDKYVVQKLEYSDLTGDIGDIGITEIDGGTF